VVHEDAAHSPQMEKPADVAREIAAFLDRPVTAALPQA
jgi:hypothetical protein